ncbi:MAG: hypothetical protein CVU39_07655 [Chloroflexi bacterium HGW-Chloroflexi-10]|nr:MAG: hypothetical protein CVU39_07655 [Chloroflexi bacterium HGW-Chloroflexi-10]
MLNEIMLEGIVVRETWRYMNSLFFRLGVYRDHDLPTKPFDQDRDAADYINVRLDGGANGLIQIRRGMRLRVHGFMQSRDFQESLEEFIGKARKNNHAELFIETKGLHPNQILIDRNTVEVVARRLVVLENGSEKKEKINNVVE